MNLLRLLKVILRGLRPISRSLAQISVDLHQLARIQTARAQAEINLILPVEGAKPSYTSEFATEISYDVAEPKVDQETGKPVIEDADGTWDTDTNWKKIFGVKQ
jgi:hypothetical protein